MYKGTPDDRLSEQFRSLLRRAKLNDRGLSFYRLRHLHRTLTDECLDWPAANTVMGHADASMAGQYREKVSDQRVKRVCEFVRAWLYDPAIEGTGGAPFMG
jgi:integrase